MPNYAVQCTLYTVYTVQWTAPSSGRDYSEQFQAVGVSTVHNSKQRAFLQCTHGSHAWDQGWPWIFRLVITLEQSKIIAANKTPMKRSSRDIFSILLSISAHSDDISSSIYFLGWLRTAWEGGEKIEERHQAKTMDILLRGNWGNYFFCLSWHCDCRPPRSVLTSPPGSR